MTTEELEQIKKRNEERKRLAPLDTAADCDVLNPMLKPLRSAVADVEVLLQEVADLEERLHLLMD